MQSELLASVKQSHNINIETRIVWRGRENYQTACQYLVNIRRLFQKIGKSKVWTTYLMDLRGQKGNLPALKDEMAKAGL